MICPYCKVEHHRPKWCSDYCKFEFMKQQKRENNSKRKIKSGKCLYCQEEFTARRRVDEIYCSNNCKKEWHKKESRLLTNTERCSVNKKCPVCEKTFSPLKTLRQEYCSSKCCYFWQKKCYKALQTCYDYFGEKKKNHAHELLGFTPEQLREHIQSFPNWEQLKESSWHLDHIFPIIAFVEKGITDLKLINCLDNLRPLSKEDNESKNDSYSEEDFKKWLVAKGVIR